MNAKKLYHNESVVSRRDFLRTGSAAVAGAALSTMAIGPKTVFGGESRKKIRMAVVGGGFGCAFHWHLDPDCIVEAVSDLREDRRKALMDRYKCSKSYPSLEKLILDKNVDAVAIFTGAPDHVRHSVACMEAGKHVISAVPAATTMEDAEKLIATAKKTGLTYMMAETSYYYQSVITARKWYQEGQFGNIFYTEAEYHHASPEFPKKGSLAINPDGSKTWRYGYPPMLYPTHSTSLLIGLTGERLAEVMCLGWEYGIAGMKDNVYDNPFMNSTAFFKTDKGHGFRVSEFHYGAIPLTVNAKWYGTKKSFLMSNGKIIEKPLTITARDKSSRDEAGFSFQEALIEQYDQPQWWQTDLLPEPMRVGGGHDGSQPFITHEFIDALMHDRQPTVNVVEALAYTVPGIIAHQSALQGGKQMKIPQLV
ncbi:MAG: hypothetical protein A2X04_15890 [Bacteroidetes bacterium GWF2_41_9]|nr:MAG: hypothetical protein A2X04_15890 [Bacteroidetes bacterium GWF2_41_9]HBH82598.1 oxidoreductase [Bacteroidales bacterium]HCU19093.1 oxidoreductase [Bacteroidales bacterium]